MSADPILSDEATSALASYLDEMFEGVFHDRIATAGKALTILSVGTYCYQKLAKTAIGQSDLSYSLAAHLRLAYERAVMSTNTDFMPRLVAALEHGSTYISASSSQEESDHHVKAPSEGERPGLSPVTSTSSSDFACPKGQNPQYRRGLLPLDAIKSSLLSGLLSKQEKIDAWGEVRRQSLAFFLVVTYMRALFLSACTIRNSLLVAIHLEDQDAAKKRKSQQQSTASSVTSKWSLFKRFIQNRTSGGGGDGTSAFFLDMMMSAALGSLGGSSTSSPFAEDGPEGSCSPVALMHIVLSSVDDVVHAALRVVDVTLSQMDPVDKGECDEDDMSILLDVISNAFEAPEPWLIFLRLKGVCADQLCRTEGPSKARSVNHPDAVGGGGDGQIFNRSFPTAASGSTGQCASSRSTMHDAGNSRQPSRSPSEDVAVSSRSSSSARHGDSTPFALPVHTAHRLALYLHDTLCTSDDVGLLCETILHNELARMRELCLTSFAANAKYGSGKRPTLVAASQLDKFRQQVKEDRIDNVPLPLQRFAQELLKASARQIV